MILATMKDSDDDDEEEENSKGVVVGCDICEEPLSIGDSVYACKTINLPKLSTSLVIKFEHKGHPQDTLTLQLRPDSFRCDACNAKDEGLFYRCDSCDFWIHKTCASLATTTDIPHHHHEHPLLLMYSLPENLYIFSYANFATNTFDGMNGCIIVQTADILPISNVPRMHKINLLPQEIILMLVKA